ncbi:MAG: MFS transporter [Acidimicrobiales bacterium]
MAAGFRRLSQIGRRGQVSPLPRPFWFIWAGTLVNRICYFVEPFLALYLARSLRLQTPTIGLILTSFGVGSFVSQPLGGLAADHIGRRRTLVTGMVATAASYGFLVTARGDLVIAIAAFCAGLAIDLYRPAVSALIADLVDEDQRRRAYGLNYWALNLGVSVAGVLGGYFASHSFHLLFALDGATCLGFAVLIAKGVPELGVPSAPSGEGSGYGVALHDALLLALTAATLLTATVYIQSFATLPLAMRADHLSPFDYGIAYTVNPVAVIVLQPVAIRLLARRSAPAVLIVSSLLVGAGFGLDAFAHSLLAYAATVLVWTLGEIGGSVVGPALIADIAPAHQRGRYNGVFSAAFGGAAILGPLVGTQVLGHLGRTTLWSGCVVLGALAALLTAAIGPTIKRRSKGATVPATAPAI